MKAKGINPAESELSRLCGLIRTKVGCGELDDCISPICKAMEQNPHSPAPHNLMGIVLEKMGDHAMAMKHFRAARALDPTYRPAAHNLNTYGTFFSRGSCAFDDDDIPLPSADEAENFYGGNGFGRSAGQ